MPKRVGAVYPLSPVLLKTLASLWDSPIKSDVQDACEGIPSLQGIDVVVSSLAPP